jgi:hypothetical protein
MRDLIYLLTLCIILCSCNRTESIENKLCGNNHKYWLYTGNFTDNNANIQDAKQMFFHYFDTEGKFYRCFKKNIYAEVRIVSFPHNDMDLPNIWELNNDTLILNGISKTKIKYISDDVMILQGIYSKRNTVYISVSDNIIGLRRLKKSR